MTSTRGRRWPSRSRRRRRYEGATVGSAVVISTALFSGVVTVMGVDGGVDDPGEGAAEDLGYRRVGTEHDVIELGRDVVGVETGDGVVEGVEPPARLAATVADLGRDAYREHAGLPGLDEVRLLVVAVELLDEPENRRAPLRPADEVDLDGVGSGKDDPTTGVDPHTDPPAPQDLGEAAEARRELVDDRPVVVGHALNTTPRSGMRR